MAVSDRELQDLRALVTGGTKGIGHAVAVRLRESGAKVLVTARTAPSDVPNTDFVAADVATPRRASIAGNSATTKAHARRSWRRSAGSLSGDRLDLAKSPNSWRFSRHHVRRPSREPNM
jgi:NAD(P)-dependent dehydrogenase (short-subunit alcohol dehydrogenase family)